jgi:hypothetical protein
MFSQPLRKGQVSAAVHWAILANLAWRGGGCKRHVTLMQTYMGTATGPGCSVGRCAQPRRQVGRLSQALLPAQSPAAHVPVTAVMKSSGRTRMPFLAGVGPVQGGPAGVGTAPDPTKYGITPELERFVCSLTYSTFRCARAACSRQGL